MLDELRAEARQLIEEEWACVEALAKAISRHKELDGDRVREIIERVEDRLRRLPPSLAKQLKSLRSEDSPSKG